MVKTCHNAATSVCRVFIMLARMMSEKYDGTRAYWDGRNFYQRNGTIIITPVSINNIATSYIRVSIDLALV